MFNKKQYMKQWHKNHPNGHGERKAKYMEQYYLDNKEKFTKHNKQYYKDNREGIRKQHKQYYEDNPERMKDMYLQRNYGISYKDWQKIWDSQGGKCAICGKNFTKSSNYGLRSTEAHVDHNHKTKMVRGLLCVRCNSGIGHFDNLELTTKMIEYLRGGINYE